MTTGSSLRIALMQRSWDSQRALLGFTTFNSGKVKHTMDVLTSLPS